jgi:hypothetical protein
MRKKLLIQFHKSNTVFQVANSSLCSTWNDLTQEIQNFTSFDMHTGMRYAYASIKLNSKILILSTKTLIIMEHHL